MKLSTNIVAQTLALGIQIANQFGSLIPDKHKPLVALVVGVAQLVVGFLAHFSNIDGTPQSMAGPKDERGNRG